MKEDGKPIRKFKVIKLNRQRKNKETSVHESQAAGSYFSKLRPYSHWFSTGSSELFSSIKPKQQSDDKPKYKFSDLVDIPFLVQLLNLFYKATGIPYGLHDENNNIISGIGWQDICTRFHRACPQTELRCRQSDDYIYNQFNVGSYVGYKCKNGLMDFGTPIIVEGQHLASIFLGQFLLEPPDEEYFRQQAREFGFDEEEYIQALRRVPVIPAEQVDAIMQLYSQLGEFLATLGLERKRQLEAADKAIREKQELLDLVWETSSDGFWDWNVTTGQIYSSPRLAEITNNQTAGFNSVNYWLERVHLEDINEVMKNVYECFDGRNDKFEVEYRILTSTGEWKWVLDRGQVVERDNQGNPLRLVGTKIDITKLKQVESALLQSRTKFARAFQCSPDPMAIITFKEGRYVEVNQAFENVFKYTREETIGCTSLELDIWPEPGQRESFIEQFIRQMSIRDLELPLRIKTGEIRTFSMSAEVIELDGESHLLTTYRDITESKLKDEALRFSEECFSKAFDESPLIKAITSLKEGRLLKYNHSFCRNLGYDREELENKTIFESNFWVDLNERLQVINSLLAKQPVQDMEIRFRKKSGEERLGLLTAQTIEVNGELCLLSILTDITELRKMEMEINRIDRLNLVGEMAASIGHEIRNPMTTVRGYLQLLRENGEYQQLTEYFDLMIEELDRANSIITEFLSLARNKVVDLKPTDLNNIIKKTLPLIQAQAMRQEQYIKLELNNLPYLLVDQKEIRQLIINLVKNALESMSAPGVVTIRTYVENDQVILAVQDEGPGIESEYLEKIGTPFFTTKKEGTGLGLAVCYRIANQHKARIKIETGPSGTTFFVIF